jgi:hypothetical protein
LDRSGDKISTFINLGTPGQVSYKHAPQYSAYFPEDLTGWVLLRDFNGDGKADIFTADGGGVKVYLNTSFAQLTFNLQESQVLYDRQPDSIRPSLLDLVIGKRDGLISYFENIGTASAPNFSLITDSLGMANTNRAEDLGGYSTPFVYQEQGEYKILSGAENGFIYQFGDIEGNLTGVFSVDSSFQGIWEGVSSSVAMADLNNDQLLDLLIGNLNGGIALYLGDTSSVPVMIREVKSSTVNVYPNPAQDEVHIDLGGHVINGAVIEIVNVVGQLMYRQDVTEKKSKVNTSTFPSGMYFVCYGNGLTRVVTKMSIQ